MHRVVTAATMALGAAADAAALEAAVGAALALAAAVVADSFLGLAAQEAGATMGHTHLAVMGVLLVIVVETEQRHTCPALAAVAAGVHQVAAPLLGVMEAVAVRRSMTVVFRIL